MTAGAVGNVRVLRVLVTDPAGHSAPHLSRTAGLSLQGTRLVLKTLSQQHLVTARGSGRSQLYFLNAASPLAQAVSGLFQSEQQRWDTLLARIRAMLARHGPQLLAAWVYGSVARGEDTAQSDVDPALLVSDQAAAERVRDDLAGLAQRSSGRSRSAFLRPASSRRCRQMTDGGLVWSRAGRCSRA